MGPIAVRSGVRTHKEPRAVRLGLAVLFAATGVLHLVAPQVFEAIVPGWAGNARVVVYVSGGAELVASALLVRRSSARLGGWYAAVLLVSVWPANIKMALDGGILAWLRVPLQVPLIGLAVLVARRSPPPGPALS